MDKVLVTGGTGFIGSHTVVELIETGYDVVIIDNLCNSRIDTLDEIAKICGKKPVFHQFDLRDENALNAFFEKEKDISAVIHFAAFKAVGQSVKHPIQYYDNNVGATISILKAMAIHGVNNFIFSSSATVYGDPDVLPIDESAPIKPATSPYGNTKQINEEMISDLVSSNSSFKAISLRYFNPIGAHESGLIGELPLGVPDNLIPYLTQTVGGLRDVLSVFGGDYDTPDGTCIRDYIHVVDVATAHVAALNRLLTGNFLERYEVFNIGTGRGFSVLEVIASFEKSTGERVNYQIVDRRPGDVPVTFASTTLANNHLQWKAKRSLDEMTRDAWRWQKNLKRGD